MDIAKELAKRLLNETNTDQRLDAYNEEIEFYEIVANGDLEELEKRIDTFGANKATKGVLSPNEVTNNKYHSIILTAMLSRFCIEKGMEIAVAYNLSDIYIELIDQARTVSEINEISKQMATDYCTRIRNSVKKNVVSRHIVLAVDYIRSNIQDSLTVESIAEALSLNPSYLSKLFKHEMGKTISQYIRDQKINVACNMLRHLDESSLTIANYLGFSSQSHFIQVFKKTMGMTPEEYRKRNYRQSWMGHADE